MRPHSSTLLKIRPHYSQSSRENATPFSGTSSLDSYKEVAPPPRPRHKGGAEKEEEEVEKL